ncbi:MAG: RpiB/LacA/LacB family sugar-phosphate isomerase [Parcubacteria group bacterium]|nr:RpiB/LacA/LacB family sugar-phosphate isomerase [Parcubacteria group bacterium]
MVIYIGADHRGFKLKANLIEFLRNEGYEVIDAGNKSYDEKDDYTDFAAAVAKEVSKDPERNRGIVICGSGAGVDVTANKFKGVRSTLALSPDQVYDARHDDDINVLSIASNFTSEADALRAAQVFLTTSFAGEERHRRRIEKINQIESER